MKDLVPVRKKDIVPAAERCSLCNLAADKGGNTLRAAQARRHAHFLEFSTSGELMAHLKGNNDSTWVSSGGADAVLSWWMSKKR